MVVKMREPNGEGEGEWRVHVSGEKLPGGEFDDETPEDVDLDAPGPESGILDIGSRLRLEVIPTMEWSQIFEEVCSHVSEMYFDDATGGLDWRAVCAKYRQLLPRVRSRSELTDMVSELLAELGVSHFSFADPDDDTCGEEVYETGGALQGHQGHLGARVIWHEVGGIGAWRVVQMIKGDVWDAKYCGPLARPGVGITEGSFITAVNRAKVTKDVSLDQMLANCGGFEVLVTYVPPQFVASFMQVGQALHQNGGVEGLRKLVASHRRALDARPQDKHKGKRKKAKQKTPKVDQEALLAKALQDFSIDVSEGPIWRTARVRACGSQVKRNAVLRDLVHERWDFVHAATQGRVGYVHVPDTCEMGFAEFYRYYGCACEREALILDLRCNEGGYASELLLKQLRNPPMGFNISRSGRGKVQVSPELASPSHLVLLIDENTSSDGECWADAFKRFGMGKVVGVRTWGGVVSIGGADVDTIDGGELSIPYQHYYALGVGYGLENHGAEPDFEVPWVPSALADLTAVSSHRDPQLAEALRVVQEMLARSEPAVPTIPSFPRTRLHRLRASGAL